MKINWKYLKKTPVIIGGIVLFFLVLWLFNRSASGTSGSTSVATGGPDPNAVLASQTQLAGMQIQAAAANTQAQYALAAKQMDVDASNATTAVQAQIANNTLVAQQNIANANIALQSKALDYNFQQSVNNSQFALDYAQQAYDYSLGTTAINANLQAHLSDTAASVQTHLADNQLDAYKFGTALSIIPSLKKGDRDNALISLTLNQVSSHGTVGVMPSSGGGGFSFLNAISPISNLVG